MIFYIKGRKRWKMYNSIIFQSLSRFKTETFRSSSRWRTNVPPPCFRNKCLYIKSNWSSKQFPIFWIVLWTDYEQVYNLPQWDLILPQWDLIKIKSFSRIFTFFLRRECWDGKFKKMLDILTFQKAIRKYCWGLLCLAKINHVADKNQIDGMKIMILSVTNSATFLELASPFCLEVDK